MNKQTSLFAITLLLFTAYSHSAIVTMYNDRGTFESAAGSISEEDFNSFVSDQSFNGVTLGIGDFSLFADQAAGRNILDTGDVEGNGKSFDNTNFLSVFLKPIVGIGNGPNRFIIKFDQHINAFGFDQILFGNGQGNSQMTILGQAFLNNISGTPDEKGFFGFISDTAFDEITFSSAINDGFSLDNFAYSFANTTQPSPPEVSVSAPSAYWMLALALPCIVLRKKYTG